MPTSRKNAPFRPRFWPAIVLRGACALIIRGNAIFPHWNRQGLCGFEIKTGASPGGEKGLWCSRGRAGYTTLVVAETAVDALSYAALKPDPAARYVSTAGELNPAQPGLLQSAFEKLPEGGRVILAMDNDAGGKQLSEKIQALFREINGAGLRLEVDRPPTTGQDWNDVLRASVAKKAQSKDFLLNLEVTP